MKGAPLPPSGHAHLSRLSALERGYFRCKPPLPREDSPASLTSSTDHQPMLEHPKSRGAIGLKVPDNATGHMPQRALRHGPVPPEGVRLLPRRASFTKGGLPHRFTSFQTRRGVLTSAVNLLYQGRASVVQVLRLLARRSRGRATTSVTEWHSAGGPSVSEAVGSGFLELAADRAVFVLRIGPEDSSARKSSEPVRARRSLQDATETVGKSQVVVVGVQGAVQNIRRCPS